KEGDAVRKGERLVNLDGNVYRAPFSGVVNYLPFKSGENIFVQLPVLVLTDLSHRYIVVSLEQQGAIRVRAGQKVKLSFDSMRQQNYEGIVESVYSYSTSFLARINVSSLPAEILPEMTADVAIVVREATRALVIPVNAIENGVVWRKRGAMIPEKTEIKLGIVDGAFAELVSGDIQEGDRLLIRKKVSP
ncbi:MAG: efflux RND transporter periplasmic adaptor subunit, partial [Bdellovibrionota bacterium]